MNFFFNPLQSRYESQLSFVVWNWLIPDFPVIPWMGYLINSHRTLRHICKPAQANVQTKGSQKSCNFAHAPSFDNSILAFSATFVKDIN